MADDHDVLVLITERFEHRLTEETSALRLEMSTLRLDMAGELGKLRADMAGEFGKERTDMAQGFGGLRAEMAEGFGRLRAEMIERNAELLKWGLVFGVTQTAAVAGIVALLR